MNRLITIVGIGVALVWIASPVAAQAVTVDVGVHAGPVQGRVVFGSPPVYAPPGPHRGGPAYDPHYRGRDKYVRKHEKRWQKAQDKYYKRLRKIERERAKAERDYEREYYRYQRDVDRYRYGRH